jgi:large conductance mechanosensitive channel
MLKDFQKFIMRGNVVDLAVGVIIGAAFTGIVNSLVTDMIMPPVGVLVGGIDFSDLYIQLTGAEHYPTLQAAKAAGAATLNYGMFLNAVVKFLIVAFSVFVMINGLNKLMARWKKEEAAAPPSSTDALLIEIRDALKNK